MATLPITHRNPGAPAGTATARPGWNPNDPAASLLDWFNTQLQQNPRYVPPKGFKVSGGQVVKDVGWSQRVAQIMPYVAAAVATYGVASGIAAGLGAAGATGVGATDLAAGPGAVSGLGGLGTIGTEVAVPGAAGAGVAGAGAAGATGAGAGAGADGVTGLIPGNAGSDIELGAGSDYGNAVTSAAKGTPGWLTAALAGAGFATNMANTMAERQNVQAQIAAAKARGDQQTALDESKLDPFRQQMSQAEDLSSLDRLQHGSYTPVKLQPAAGPLVTPGAGNPYAGAIPTTTGGYSYEKSPQLLSGAQQLENDVSAGHTAPTMTSPANYGKTATLDLNAGAPAGTATNSATLSLLQQFLSNEAKKRAAASSGAAGVTTGSSLSYA
jgi:hypothetical protein